MELIDLAVDTFCRPWHEIEGEFISVEYLAVTLLRQGLSMLSSRRYGWGSEPSTARMPVSTGGSGQ